MKQKDIILMLLFILAVTLSAQPENINQVLKEKPSMEKKTMQNDKEKLVILWTSGDQDVAVKMVFMYAKGSLKNDWWKSLTGFLKSDAKVVTF